MSFETPAALLLALPLALFVWRFGRIALPASAVRWALAALAALSLARPVLHRGGTEVDLVAVIDRSRSMPPGSDASAEELFALLESRRKPGERLGVVSFGREPQAERAPSQGRFGGFTRPVDGEASDLGAALLLAGDLIPEGRAGRILLVSDGRATGGDALGAARKLALRSLPVDYQQRARSEAERDVAVVELEVPAAASRGEWLQLSARVRSSTPAEVDYELSRDGAPIARGRAKLSAGEQRLHFRDVLDRGGLHEYRLSLSGAGDAMPENDRGRALLRVLEKPRALVVRRDGARGALAQALSQAGIEVEVRTRGPESLDALEGIAAVVLEDFPAQGLSESAMGVLDLFVRERGGGLLMTGGPSSFGQGGYFRSPLDALLPVSMELRREHRRAPIALAVAMDRSGSMSVVVPGGRTKMSLAAEGAVGALTLLGEGDEAAVWVVDERAHAVVPLTPVERGLDLRRVAGVQSEGGGIYIYEALEAAGLELEGSQKPVKHLLLFADANDSEEPGRYKELIADLARRKVSVSVIGLGTPKDQDAALLIDIARRGSGRVYFTDSPEALPRLFAQETIAVAGATFVEKPTKVTAASELSLLDQRDELGAPPAVGGFNQTYLRPGASLALVAEEEEKAPILAVWPRGAGKVAALTAEVDGPRAGALLTWKGYGPLMAGLLRWAMPPPEGSDAQVRVSRRGHELEVRVELDERARPFEGRQRVALLPGDGAGPAQERPLRPVADGALAARFSLTGSGSFHPVVHLGDRVLKGPPVVLPYAPEFEPSAPGRGRALLAEIAALTGGVERLSLDGAFAPGPGARAELPLGPHLAAAMLALMLTEVALRRLFGGRAPARSGRERKDEAGREAEWAGAATGESRSAEAEPIARSSEEKSAPAPAGVDSALEAARKRARRRFER